MLVKNYFQLNKYIIYRKVTGYFSGLSITAWTGIGKTALRMVLSTFSHYQLLSAVPTNYIILGYEPSKHNSMGAVKTAFGATLLAPAIHRKYALKDTGGDYRLNLEGLLDQLVQYDKKGLPVRIVGFPAYFYFLLTLLKENHVTLKLSRRSKVMLGGGWKQFFAGKIEKEELYALSEEMIGIPETGCKEFFSAVEHSVLYCDCGRHHFHIPAYSRVIIRDVNTLEPVKNGTPGILNLITPLGKGMPFISIMTDDLAIMHDLSGFNIPWLPAAYLRLILSKPAANYWTHWMRKHYCAP